MDDCLFCKIAAGEIPAKIVYEDERVVAFDDIRPQAPTHTLIIPREHFASLNELPEDRGALLSDCLFAARRIAADRGIAPPDTGSSSTRPAIPGRKCSISTSICWEEGE